MKSICSGCDTIFTSLSSFDKHRVGTYGGPIYVGKKVIGRSRAERRCLSVEGMVEKGMVLNGKGWWASSVFDVSRFERAVEVK
jgi:hypothetical protein